MLKCAGRLFCFVKMKKFFFAFLFFLFAKLYSLEANHSVTHLWSDSSGSAFLYNWNLKDDWFVKNQNFYIGANISYLDSSVDYLKTSAVKGDFCAEYSNEFFGFHGDFGFFSTDAISISANNIYNQQEILGFNGKVAIPFYINSFSIKPYFGFFSGETETGDFYWFYGNIKNPYLGQYGIQLTYKNHNLDGFFVAGKTFIFNNENSELVNIFGKLFVFTYKQSWKSEHTKFEPYIGGVFFYGDFSGAVTDKNQSYFLYPYKYYKMNGNINAFAVLNGIFFEYKKYNFCFSVDFNSVFFTTQAGIYDISWKYKRNLFFDGSVGSDSKKIDFLNLTGLISIDCKAEYSFLIKKVGLNIFFAKDFLIPFKISTNSSSRGGNKSSDNNKISEFILSWIFSGISGGISILL